VGSDTAHPLALGTEQAQLPGVLLAGQVDLGQGLAREVHERLPGDASATERRAGVPDHLVIRDRSVPAGGVAVAQGAPVPGVPQGASYCEYPVTIRGRTFQPMVMLQQARRW
jgi:hypothetical protein